MIGLTRILVTGAAGMIGSHLMEAYAGAGETDLLGCWFAPTIRMADIEHRFNLLELDIRDADAVQRVIAAHRPLVVHHLAAQSLPTRSWEDPRETMEVNVQGTVNLFEAIRALRRDAPDYDPIVLIAGSSAQYGASLTPATIPVDEDVTPLPLHPYGVSKVAQDLLAYQYWRSDGIRCIRARIFNCTGPRKRADVVSDFARRVALIERDGGTLRVGNLESRRAIVDVRDLVAALQALVERGTPGAAYNICADHAVRIGDLVALFERLSGRSLTLDPDPALLRPTDEAVILGRVDRLVQATGWRQRIPLEDTIRSVLGYERADLAR